MFVIIEYSCSVTKAANHIPGSMTWIKFGSYLLVNFQTDNTSWYHVYAVLCLWFLSSLIVVRWLKQPIHFAETIIWMKFGSYLISEAIISWIFRFFPFLFIISWRSLEPSIRDPWWTDSIGCTLYLIKLKGFPKARISFSHYSFFFNSIC